MLSSDILHGDDTPVPVLAPGLGKTRTGRLWTYVRDGRPHGSSRPPAAAFLYAPDRKGEQPRKHLKAFTGVLHADGYAGFNAVFETGTVIEAACWAHERSGAPGTPSPAARPPPAQTLPPPAPAARERPASTP